MSEHERNEESDVRPRSTVGPLQDTIDQLIEYVEAAKAMPLSTNVLVDRDYVLTTLTRLRADLPDELRAARWMVREREAFIARTNERASEIVDKAKAESRRLVSESYVLAEAVEEANILVRRAEGESRRIRLEAEDDLERSLEQVENLMAELLRKTHTARNELHQARPPATEVPLRRADPVTLRIQVSDLLSRPGHGREDTAFLRLCFQVGEASVDDEVAVQVRLRSLTDGVVARGTAATTVDLVCTRCLTTWSEPLSAAFEAVFRLHPDDADDEFGIEEGGWIDLEPIVHDEVSLAVPAVPLCRPDCAGLCQTCGTDLNTAPCGGHGDESVSPFAALKQLFEP